MVKPQGIIQTVQLLRNITGACQSCMRRQLVCLPKIFDRDTFSCTQFLTRSTNPLLKAGVTQQCLFPPVVRITKTY